MKALALSALAILPLFAAAQGGDDMMAGLTALKKADHTRAEVAFTRAVNTTPEQTKAWYYRAVNRMGMGDFDGAKRDLDQLLTIAPDDLHGRLRRAEVLKAQGSADGARTDLEHILTLQERGPVVEHALLQLGHMDMAKGDLAAARGNYDCLVDIAPYSAIAHCDRGIALAAQYKDAEAITSLERAIGLDPTMREAWTHSAIVYLRTGQRTEACEALHTARDLGDKSVDEMLLIYCE
jgi:tetratricopeptide (TPR) repeat protein